MPRPTPPPIGPGRLTGVLRLFCVAAGALVILFVLAAARTTAATGNSHWMNDPRAGIRLDVDTRWVGSAGYRPVRVTATPLATKPDDRVLDITFHVRRDDVHSYDLSVSHQIVVPAGSTRPLKATIAVPQHTQWLTYSLAVRMDGREMPRLGISRASCQTASLEWTECFPAMLFVGQQLPDTARLAQHFPIQAYNQYGGVSGTTTNRLPTAMAISAAELPDRWIDYSGIDVLCIELDQLDAIARARPEALAAILDWTAAGGNLCVIGAGPARLEQLDDLLARTGRAGRPRKAQQSVWRKPSVDCFGQMVHGALAGQAGMIGDYYIEAEELSEETEEPNKEGASPADAPSKRRPPATGAAPFLLRPYELGMVAALARENGFDRVTRDEWGWLLNEIGNERWLWYQRHGLSLARTNNDFLDFLIPGVGLAPVTEFCILISLFALAIGPVNYYLLRRWRRLYLLVVTIPLGAAAVTLLLFVYAILADGLGTRVRVRSLTRLDQQSGQAVCWSRMSYYAGLSPAGGLTFPQDMVVYPLELEPAGAENYMRSPPGLRRDMVWNGEQRLRSGFLASRTPTQLVAVRSRSSRRGLKLETTGDRMSLVNQLGTPIEQLLVCDGDGKTYWAEGVPADGQAVLEPIRIGDARNRLGKAIRDHRPQVPEGMQRYSPGGMFGLSRRRYWMWGGNSALNPPTQTTSRLETELRSLAGVSSQEFDPLNTPRSYVAVVGQSPEVVLGVATARQVDSFHVILGNW